MHGGVHPSIDEIQKHRLQFDFPRKSQSTHPNGNQETGDMFAKTLNRRELLGTTARGMAALAALTGSAALSSQYVSPASAETCIANHQQLAQNLKTLIAKSPKTITT